MAYHDNLRTIPLASESEEDGEIEKESSAQKDVSNDDSESSKEDNDDSLDIKPPQANLKSRDSGHRHEDKKKSRHSRKHESRRREHHRTHERNPRREGRSSRPADSSRKGNREMENRTVRYRDEPINREKEREFRKGIETTVVRDVRDIRVKKDLREGRERIVEAKSKEERHSDGIEENMAYWRNKRLKFIERQREQDRGQPERNFSRREESQASGRDLREKLREKERLQQEKERRLERFRSPSKDHESGAPPSEEKKSKSLHISPEPFVDEEQMEYEDKEVEISEESDVQSDDKDDTESESDSSDSDTEDSSHSKMDEDEGHGQESSGEEEEEPTPSSEQKVEETPKPASPPKPPPAPETAPKLPPYLPAIQGCRSVEEFHCLNRIEEGTYGVVYRARDKRTDEIVALKRLKMEKEKEGFPITSLREINTLLKAQHDNIVTVREIVVGSNMDKIYIVMDYVEHDLKSLMETMKQPFLVGEVKTLMIQLLCAVAHLHDNWILHRDLKTSNLLLSHKGILKVGDFGLAREYGSPLKPYTPIVVTLWYRAPELLLGTKQYSTPIDLWSVGCIFGELLTMKPLFPGKSEIDQLNRIFKDLGTPSEKIWPGYSELPLVKKVTFTEYPYNNLRSRFGHNFTDLGFDLLNRFLTYNPTRRITAEEARKHEFFNEKPKPIAPSMFPTWPAKSEQMHRKQVHSPKPPSGGKQYARQMGEADDEGLMAAAGFHMAGAQEGHSAKGPGFSLKF
ncbi:cyclin-dependent kinase 11B-like isoform X2 [Uloborus diversus]|uniref:cyclin-dependent kinase 11B-like isoform X2 n=1 Tax=Uloborus diversus TaxID=327109 RepID=UPI002409F8D6|nr:cyclin-dependent kinase 11B-like isoform X2 [Uloborus diversus]